MNVLLQDLTPNPLLSILSAVGSFLLGVSILATGAAWIWEHVFRNYFNRYKLDFGHDGNWIQQNVYDIVKQFEDKCMFTYGTLYCFKIINKGTTHDYIYRAELNNRKSKIIDISTNCILTGTNYQNENLPHRLNSLQGEVWFAVAKDVDFINVKEPILTIYTAARKYDLIISNNMFVISKKQG